VAIRASSRVTHLVIEGLTQKINEESDPLNLEDLLQGRAFQEEQVAMWEAELERVNTRIAELEKLTAGRKRPPRPAPVKTEKVRPAQEGEEGEAPPADEPPAEEPPSEEEPPPPPPAR